MPAEGEKARAETARELRRLAWAAAFLVAAIGVFAGLFALGLFH